MCWCLPLSALTCLLLNTAATSGTAIHGAISALGLIGSHFGVPANATYDYIVVGGGTAGLTVATRLAENSSNTVAVIEAGGFYEMNNGNLSIVPGYSFLNLIPNPLVDWAVSTQPQAGFAGRSFTYNQGKQLGGSSGKNLQAYHRSTTDAFQTWANVVDDQSYTFNNLLKYFERSVQFHPPNTDLRPSNQSAGFNISSFSPTGGPLQVSYPNSPNSFSSYVARALPEVGIKEAPDFNSGQLLGYQSYSVSVDPIGQTRSSSETSFLRYALQHTTNMITYNNALAQKILFNKRKRATGVLVNSGGLEYVLSANKEIIVSAGAFRSPQLLMVSGIGNKATLGSLGIPVVSDLPGVGQNMWDHGFFGPTFETNLVTPQMLGDPAFAAAQSAEYTANQTGVLTNNGVDVLAWEKLPQSLRNNLSCAAQHAFAAFPPDWPEIEYIPDSSYLGGPFTINTITMLAAVVSPLSRGNVTINSTDTSKNPIISPNLLLDPRDRELAVQAFKRSRQIFAASAMQPILVGKELVPGANVTTDAEILDYISQSAQPLYHASCSCAMGTPKDPMAVIDTHARVYGASGLRVVDASSFPLLPPGHPQSIVYALAEKIADLINTGQ